MPPKERPIVFAAESIKAILRGAKTQTRRVIKPQPQGADYWTEHDGAFYPNTVDATTPILRCAYGTFGERLWVRETWAHDCEHCRDVHCGIRDHIWYRANEVPVVAESFAGDARWRSPIYMPRWASRLTLEVTGVKVERVQDISEEDGKAEGLYEWTSDKGVNYYGLTRADVWEQDPRITYKRLWDSINAKRGYSWESNPFVWAISFRRA